MSDTEFTNKQLLCLWIVGILVIVLISGMAFPVISPQMSIGFQLIMSAVWSFMIVAIKLGQIKRKYRRRIEDITANIKATSAPYKIEPNADRTIPVHSIPDKALGEIVTPEPDQTPNRGISQSKE